MSFKVVIPARYQSSRLPGKPLIDLAGKSMIQRVYEQAVQSEADEVYVATDDVRIREAVERFGGKVIMTRASHESGTDRLQEVVQKLSLQQDDIVVNVQGDEPLIPPATINQVAQNLIRHADASVATLSESITDASQIENPNIVKVVADVRGMALYFSRAPIPANRDGLPLEKVPYMRHIGLYAYRVGLLNHFVTWPVGVLEAVEKLEQLRVLENNHRIHVAPAAQAFEGGVDTAADVERVEKILQGRS